MSTTRGIRTFVGVALASSVLLIAGCSSSGSVKGDTAAKGSDKTFSVPSAGGKSSSSSGDSSSSDSPSSSDSSSDSSGSTGGSTGGSDEGCTAALADAGSNAMGSLDMSNPSAAAASIKAIGDKLHADAKKSSKNAAVINKLGDDYVAMGSALSSGKMPDTKSIMDDVSAMASACTG